MNDFTPGARPVTTMRDINEGLTLADWSGDRLYRYLATVRDPIERHVHDGDTFDVALDLGLNTWLEPFTVRPYGYDSPELNTPAGREARDHLIDLFNSVKQQNDGKLLLAIETIQDRHGSERMTFDRYLCHVGIVTQGYILDLAGYMIEAKQGVERTR